MFINSDVNFEPHSATLAGPTQGVPVNYSDESNTPIPFIGTPISRRSFAKGAMLALAAVPISAALSACSPAGASSKAGGTVTFASYGGAYNDALKHFTTPFSKKTGIDVRLASNTSLSGLKQQIASNSIQWDIAELSGTEYELAISQGVKLEALDFDIIHTASIPSYAKKEFGIQYAFFLEVAAWDKRQVTSPPKDWAAFFDGGRYPYKRSLPNSLAADMLLEFALLSDGVPLKGLYPLDVDRALRAIERLSKDQVVFYTSNQEVIQHMQTKEAGLGMPYSGRVVLANKGGAELDFTVNQAGATGDYLVIPKGAKNAKGAMQLIDFICNDAKSAADFMEETGYGVSNLNAIKKLSPETAANVPTSPDLKDKIFFRDDAWWSKNFDAVSQKYQAWQANYS
jgi:putative spermidine/putrescine transport system substrate-binding protein